MWKEGKCSFGVIVSGSWVIREVSVIAWAMERMLVTRELPSSVEIIGWQLDDGNSDVSKDNKESGRKN